MEVSHKLISDYMIDLAMCVPMSTCHVGREVTNVLGEVTFIFPPKTMQKKEVRCNYFF